MVICLERGADSHMAQLMPLPLTVSCFSKIHIGFTFFVPAHLDSPGKKGPLNGCVCACVSVLFSLFEKKISRSSKVVENTHTVNARLCAVHIDLLLSSPLCLLVSKLLFHNTQLGSQALIGCRCIVQLDSQALTGCRSIAQLRSQALIGCLGVIELLSQQTIHTIAAAASTHTQTHTRVRHLILPNLKHVNI